MRFLAPYHGPPSGPALPVATALQARNPQGYNPSHRNIFWTLPSPMVPIKSCDVCPSSVRALLGSADIDASNPFGEACVCTSPLASRMRDDLPSFETRKYHNLWFHLLSVKLTTTSASTPYAHGINSPLDLPSSASTPLHHQSSAVKDPPFSPLFSPSFGQDLDVGSTPRMMGEGSLGQLDTPMVWAGDGQICFPPLVDSQTPSCSHVKSGVPSFFANSTTSGSGLLPRSFRTQDESIKQK